MTRSLCVDFLNAGGCYIVERVLVLWEHCRVGKAKRAHQTPGSGGHGAQEHAFAHPTRDASRSKSALAYSLAAITVANAPATACDAPQRPMQQIELMFGRNIGGHLRVGEAAWSRFLAQEITPRFPDGLTVLSAVGQWRNPAGGRVMREPSKMVVIVTADDAAVRDRIAAIVAAYKQRFHQRSVGVISRSVCAAF